ncbi:MAG TPA: hypothetical protein VHC22_13340 [Pirellulales bacterium]|nr:hypothetical protein [Pirellulales bacterium]
MARSIISIATLCVLLLVASAVFSQAQPAAPKGLFATLAAGQIVTLNDKGQLLQITTIEGAEAGTHTVTEVGNDYIVVEDMAKVSELRIPVYAVKTVVHVRAKNQ